MKYIDIESDRVPGLGFGTNGLTGNGCKEAVKDALEIGYRQIDTAESYDNEEDVGRALRESPIARDRIFLTTKVWYDKLRHDDFLAAANASLRRLGTDYVDLLLIHWPNSSLPLQEPLDALMELKQEGKARHIGVSNFTPSLLEEALEHAPVICDQVEYHPHLSQERLLERVREHDLMLTAYSPLARGKVGGDSVLRDIGERHGKSPVQVALRWLLQQPRVAAIPRSSSAEHRRSNFEIFDFELSDAEMGRIFDCADEDRLIDPPWAPDWER
jgi:2,5-diketo-D-gluconate reductase B